jgi:hypothetical protein
VFWLESAACNALAGTAAVTARIANMARAWTLVADGPPSPRSLDWHQDLGGRRARGEHGLGRKRRVCFVGEPEAELVAERRLGRVAAFAAGDDLRRAYPVRRGFADETPRRPVGVGEPVRRVDARLVLGGIDGVIATSVESPAKPGARSVNPAPGGIEKGAPSGWKKLTRCSLPQR